MKFNHYSLFRIPKEAKLIKGWGRKECLKFAVNPANGLEMDLCCRLAIAGELRWLEEHRPFYNLYPKVAKSLSRTCLEITAGDVFFQGEVVAVCFAVGHEIEVPFLLRGGYLPAKLRAVLCIRYGETITIMMDILVDGGDPSGQLCGSQMRADVKICELWDEDKVEGLHKKREDYKKVYSMVIGTHLLAKEEDYCERVLLSADEGKTGKAVEERAIRRGVNGIHIGRKQEREEVSPHTRRAHFAIRWMKVDGILRPRLRPVKATIVRRSKITAMPTGWEGGFDD